MAREVLALDHAYRTAPARPLYNTRKEREKETPSEREGEDGHKTIFGGAPLFALFALFGSADAPDPPLLFLVRRASLRPEEATA